MKHRILLTSLLMALLAVPAAGQITIDASILESVRGHQVQVGFYMMNPQSYPSLTPLLNATGPGQTYDFTPFSYSPRMGFAYEVLASAAGTPGEADHDFGGSNWVQKQNVNGDFYAYYDLRNDGFYLLGSIFVQATDTDGNGILDQSIQKNAPPDPTYRFPLTDGSTWNQEIVGTTVGFGSTSEVTTNVDFAVEGWGTLITPVGSAPALRLRKTFTSITQNYTTTSYLFVTNSMLGASIILDSQGTVLSATYNDDGGGGPTGVEDEPVHAFRLEQNYPNPFSSVTHVPFELGRPGYVTLRVFDLLGREVGSLIDAPLPAGSYTTDFGADGLPNGIYHYRLQVDERVSIRHLIVQH